MSKHNPKSGIIAWLDQTSNSAEETREFYEKVAGWKSSPVSMGEYNDYCMLPNQSDQPVAGICHKRGENNDLPTGWIAYIVVDDLDASIESCKQHGGEILAGPKRLGDKAKYCIIKDPGGAISALYCHI